MAVAAVDPRRRAAPGHPAHLVQELVRTELNLTAIVADDERDERASRRTIRR